MKKVLISILLLSAVLLPVAMVSAQGAAIPQVNSLDELFDAIKNAAVGILGIIVFIAFIYAAFLFLTAGGSAEKLGLARTAFIWGVVGVVVGVLAWSMFEIVKTMIQ